MEKIVEMIHEMTKTAISMKFSICLASPGYIGKKQDGRVIWKRVCNVLAWSIKVARSGMAKPRPKGLTAMSGTGRHTLLG